MRVPPPVIWSFWHDGRPPVVARECLSRMRRLHPDLSVRLLTDEDIPASRPDVHALRPQHRADWMRLWVLWSHGGVWLDATIVVLAHLGGCFDLTDGDTEFQGFCLAERVAVPCVLENWAFACPPRSAFVGAWFAEFDRAVRGGLAAYRPPTDDPTVADAVRGLDLPYLTMHAAGVVIWARRLREGAPPRLRVTSAVAPSGPFAPHARSGWSVPRAVWWVMHDHTAPTTGCLLKLRGGEALLCRWLLWLGLFRPDAAVPRALGWGDRLAWQPRCAVILVLLVLVVVACGGASNKRRIIQTRP